MWKWCRKCKKEWKHGTKKNQKIPQWAAIIFIYFNFSFCAGTSAICCGWKRGRGQSGEQNSES